ncbi:CD3337/EF1877 family mobilome membrane protein [Lentibacillus sp. CBA3610]|uniref:CD3337/EF1877 family mobilome membrane protein n=1 Tax=Lentibacillus sp. CBA3610 TaxID=2518176 RepID=UPI001598C20E|nr:hypothetical protein Len3610_07305 [Lentibacillus sp. CBA3610]
MSKFTFNRIIKITLIMVVLSITGFTQPTYADDDQAVEQGEEQLGNFKEGGKSHYHLDAVPEDFAKEENFIDGIKGNLWFLNSDEITQKMNEMFNYIANIAFDMNILMTNFMLFSLDFAYDFNFINTIIEKLNEIMGEITGITGGGHFSDSGLFGNLAMFTAVFAVIYAAFLMIWKRSMFASIGTILQTIMALTIAILLFTNYATFLTGLNQVTTQASSLILAGNSQERDAGGGSQPIEANTPTNLDEQSLKNGMKDNIWALFVDRPYLYMMYGETNLNNLARSEEEAVDRVNSILKEQPNSEERFTAISNELTNYDNDYLLYDNISTRLSFTPMYLMINGIVSIPIYFLALALLIFQFWFMLIAIFAPFALLFGAIPGQFNVVKRYFIELGLPLVLKIVVSFTALVIFAISDLLYEADFIASDNGNPFVAYIAAALIHFVLFMLIFLLRKRIRKIFSAGSQSVQELREGMDELNNPLKKGIQGAGTVTGAAVGAAATGSAGAIAGANVGSSVGKAATGEGSAGDIAKSGMKAHRSQQMASLRKTSSADNSEANQVNRVSDAEARNIRADVINNSSDAHGPNAFERSEVEHASLDDLDGTHDHITQQGEHDGEAKGDHATRLADRQQREDRELKHQYQSLSNLQKSEQPKAELTAEKEKFNQSFPETNDWSESTTAVNANTNSDMFSEPISSSQNNKQNEYQPDTQMENTSDMYVSDKYSSDLVRPEFDTTRSDVEKADLASLEASLPPEEDKSN